MSLSSLFSSVFSVVHADDVAAAVDLAVNCIVMGEHATTGLRRWFSRDTSQGVLHDAPCPVWYVPAMSVAHVTYGERAAAAAM